MTTTIRVLTGTILAIAAWLAAGVGTSVRAESPLELVEQTGHTGSIESVAVSADGRHALTGSVDRTAILWDAATGQMLRTFAGQTKSVRSVALSGDSKRVLTGSEDTTAMLWDAATGQKLQTFQG